ncbi:hypothetical protein jhhlp_000402 [Lomentospora prolificans]|uniref:BZIP domain-containing protein n=1 Tax=Lomentospora prolificans TaxID=41688 RepID=A0A2N3NKZ2_9PEZI|nr:hypothetical protein jhhlp_000402 [Lomentospora prolificans]
MSGLLEQQIDIMETGQNSIVVARYAPPDMRDPSDDWTGVTSREERKRRQNRLNQRAHRRRKNKQQQQAGPSGTEDIKVLPPPALTSSPARTWSVSPASSSASEWEAQHEGLLIMTCPRTVERMRRFLREAYEEYTLHAPNVGHLPSLIRLNLIDALARNAIRIGFDPNGLCDDDLISPLNYRGPPLPDGSLVMLKWRDDARRGADCPQALAPTHLQRTVLHHPWIDLFPFPQFRDNVLTSIQAGILDDDELCLDLIEFAGGADGRAPALIVWGEASDWRSWEVTGEFLRKWGWLVRGCAEMVAATNYWRQKRGETRIIF